MFLRRNKKTFSQNYHYVFILTICPLALDTVKYIYREGPDQTADAQDDRNLHILHLL